MYSFAKCYLERRKVQLRLCCQNLLVACFSSSACKRPLLKYIGKSTAVLKMIPSISLRLVRDEPMLVVLFGRVFLFPTELCGRLASLLFMFSRGSPMSSDPNQPRFVRTSHKATTPR